MQCISTRIQASVKQQKGVTLLGLLIVGAAIAFVALVVMKMVPAYTEYMSVKKVLRAMDQESLSTMTKNEIANDFDKRATIGYITSVTGKDLTIEKNSAGVTVSVEYQVVRSIMGNVSVLLDFSASSSK